MHDLAGRSGCNDEIESNGERRHENIKERPLTCTRDVQEGTRACVGRINFGPKEQIGFHERMEWRVEGSRRG